MANQNSKPDPKADDKKAAVADKKAVADKVAADNAQATKEAADENAENNDAALGRTDEQIENDKLAAQAQAGVHPNDPLKNVDTSVTVEGPNGEQLPNAEAAAASANIPGGPAGAPANAPVGTRPANAPPERLSPVAAFPDESTKTMISPREFFVLLTGGRRVTFKQGPQEVPESLQEHPYVIAHGVAAYEGK